MFHRIHLWRSARALTLAVLLVATCDDKAQNGETTAGKEGGVCREGGACDPGLFCVDGTCKRQLLDDKRIAVRPGQAVDILFVVDNSGSMVGEQKLLAEAFANFSDALASRVAQGYRIAVVTTGMESRESDAVRNDMNQALLGCPACASLPPDTFQLSCVNASGETGRFQDRLGQNTGTTDFPNFVFTEDPSCRIVTPANRSCFFDVATQRGLVMVGTNGCGYERGLGAMKAALADDLAASYNQGFLRPGAALVVVVISDEEDCGERGDVLESTEFGGNICYNGVRGQDRNGNTTYLNPNTGEQLPFRLTAVEEYRDFLKGLKQFEAGMVKFAAIVGLVDRAAPYTTTADKIEFVQPNPDTWQVKPACQVAGCLGAYCTATPGTRYVELARLFGNDGFVDSICQTDFNETMLRIARRITCPREFVLPEPIADPATARLLLNGEVIPRYSCAVKGALLECPGPGNLCPQAGGTCVETWSRSASTLSATGKVITFAPHYDPCEIYFGKSFTLELMP